MNIALVDAAVISVHTNSVSLKRVEVRSSEGGSLWENVGVAGALNCGSHNRTVKKLTACLRSAIGNNHSSTAHTGKEKPSNSQASNNSKTTCKEKKSESLRSWC